MKKISEHQLSREHRKTKVCVVRCLDQRCDEILFGQKHKTPDVISLAGGALLLADEGYQSLLLRQIQATVNLHGVKEVVVTSHQDCGWAGGLERFSNDEKASREYIVGQLEAAKQFLVENLPQGIVVRALFFDFDGVYEI